MSVFLLWFTSPTPTPSIFNMILPLYNDKDDIATTIPSPTDTSSHKLPQALTKRMSRMGYFLSCKPGVMNPSMAIVICARETFW